MTEKDLLDSLRFVDDDLIEEAGLEQLKEEKQKKINGKVIFLRTALTAAAGICIFTAGTVMGRKITAKKDQTDGVLMMAAYPESEYEIFSTFDRLVQGKGSIFISHRMGSCRFCQEIFVLDQGKVVQNGSHEDLIKKEGIYQELFLAQADCYME